MNCNTQVTLANIYSTMLFGVEKKKSCCKKCNECEVCLSYFYEAWLGEKDQHSLKVKNRKCIVFKK